MPNKDVNETKQEPLYFKHKTQGITVMSYLLAKGGWVYKEWVNSCVGGGRSGSACCRQRGASIAD